MVKAADSSVSTELRRRVAAYDWLALEEQLDERGYARMPRLLSASQCNALEAYWNEESRFRSEVDMRRHAFGEGRYRYFGEPLPQLVAALRTHLYPPLARIANRWQQRLGLAPDLPARLRGLRERCRSAGQTQPTPLLLRYSTDGYNCLHQDRYGEVWFPLQVVSPLSRVGRDYQGGEFLLVEQRPRMQSRGEAITLERGEGLVFPNRERPIDGVRRTYRVKVRHGLSRIASGRRTALGIIFHDAI